MSKSKTLINGAYNFIVSNCKFINKQSTPYFLMFLAFSLIMSGVWYVGQTEIKKQEEVEQVFLANINSKMADNLQASLQLRMHLPTSLASIVKVDPNFAVQNFDTIAKTLIGNLTGVISLQLAPRGIVTYITDIAHNQAAIGHNLLTDKKTKTSALRAIKERITTITGPLTLRQGGEAIIVRLPIFTTSPHANGFWGFAVVLINTDILLAESSIVAHDDYRIALRSKNSDGKNGAVFFGSQEVFDHPTDTRVINLPYGSWEMAIERLSTPYQGFILNWIWLIGGLLAISFSYLIKVSSNRNIERYNQDERFRLIVESVPNSIILVNSAGEIVQINKNTEMEFKYTSEELVGQKIEILVPDGHRKGHPKQRDKFAANPKARSMGKEKDLFALRKDGTTFPVLIGLNPIKTFKEDLILVSVLNVSTRIKHAQAIKDNKKREEALQMLLDREKELNQLKSRFVAMASHEFRTPLTIINATSDIILKYADKMSQDDISLRLETIKNEVADMTSMLEDVLIIGKSDAQKLEYNPESLDVVSLVKDIITGYQLSDPDNRNITYHLSSPVIMLTLDKKWIKNIVINLISNAIKYSDKDTAVEVSINEDKAGVSLSFKDYGIGISQEDIKALFEPFYRASNVGDIPGTGLGLVVLQKVIELHNGKIEIESEVGKGSNFIVTLPNV